MAENTSWVPTEDAQRLGDELVEWFMEQAGKEARLVAPKAIEYGSKSMVDQGRGLDALRGHPGSSPSDKEAFELAVWDMVRLKVGRWTEAVLNGKPVSDDTLLDIGIYVKMAQRNRDAGSWPGVKAHEMQANIDALKRICDPPTERIVTEFTMTDGLPRVIPAEEDGEKGNPELVEPGEHRIHQINDSWRLQYRGTILTLKTDQWDLVRNADDYTKLQLVQDRNPVGGFHYQTSNPSPNCTGYHANGYCLKPIPEGITAHAKLTRFDTEETK